MKCHRCHKYCFERLQLKKRKKNGKIEKVCFNCIRITDLRVGGYWFKVLFKYSAENKGYIRRW